MAARDAKGRERQSILPREELLPKQTWPDGTPNIRAQLTSLWVLGQPHSARRAPPPEPPRFGSLRSPTPPSARMRSAGELSQVLRRGRVDETEPGTPKAAGKTSATDLRGFDDVFGVDQSPDDSTSHR